MKLHKNVALTGRQNVKNPMGCVQFRNPHMSTALELIQAQS